MCTLCFFKITLFIIINCYLIGTICCTAKNSCGYSLNISANIAITETNIGIRCDASAACGYSEGNIAANNGGNMYFSGLFSGRRIDDGWIMTTKDYNIYCTGRSSCSRSNIQNANNIYGVGSYSNRDGTITDIQSNVYLYGYVSAENANITNINGNVYCVAYFSCSGTTIKNVNNNIYGIGRYVFTNSNINNATNV